MSDGEVLFLKGKAAPESLTALRDELSRVLGVPVGFKWRLPPNIGAEFYLSTSEMPTRTAMAEAVKHVLAWDTIKGVTFMFPDNIE